MVKFKVGDKVVRIGPSMDGVEKGKIYTVKELGPLKPYMTLVESGCGWDARLFKLYKEPEMNKPTPHKHAEVIKAWADGAKIEYCLGGSEWRPLFSNAPAWSENTKYRIKPEPEPDVVEYRNYYPGGNFGRRHLSIEDAKDVMGATRALGCIKFTFDGETGKLKAAEVI